jgi:formamidopyrimidine-DNA glycosylase
MAGPGRAGGGAGAVGYRPGVPELLEVEYYRRQAEAAVGRPVAAVAVPDPHVLAAPLTAPGLRRALVGREFTAARRRGKLLVLDTGGAGRPGPGPAGPALGLRFGMTGSLVVDGGLAIERLLYSSGTFGERWVRLRIRFADGGELALHDPRRFGRAMLDPDEGALGPDAAAVGPAALAAALAARTPAGGPSLKARLLDQGRLAGVGNLLADEVLWRAGLSPARPSGSLTAAEIRRLHRHLRATLDELLERGGSHTGDLMEERRAGGRCPRDGTPLRRTTVGGRTTWLCPAHQR